MCIFHSFQVLFYSLPLVLDGCKGGREEGGEVLEEGGEDEIVEQAVDFLQALLHLMTDIQLHLEVRVTPYMYITLHCLSVQQCTLLYYQVLVCACALTYSTCTWALL